MPDVLRAQTAHAFATLFEHRNSCREFSTERARVALAVANVVRLLAVLHITSPIAYIDCRYPSELHELF